MIREDATIGVVRLASFIACLATTLLCAGNEVSTLSIRLAPSMETLPAAGIEPLHAEVPEAIRHRDGLWISPEEPFRWAYLAERDSEICFSIEIDREAFEEAALTIWNWHNRPVFRRKVSADRSHLLRVFVEGTGVYQMTLDGYRKGQCEKRLVRSFSVTRDQSPAREAWKTDEFFLGICGFPGRYHWSHEGVPTLPEGIYPDAARELEAEVMSRLGFQVARIDVSMEMGRAGNEAGYQYNFRRMDSAVEAWTSRGMKLALQLMNAPDWAVAEKYQSIEKDRWRYPREEEAQRAYVRALLERYGKHAALIQVFNEPDQTLFWAGQPEEYIRQFLYTSDEIKEYRKGLPIVNGGYSLFERDKTEVLAKALKGETDYVAWHCHGDLPELIKDFNYVKKLHRKLGYQEPRFLNTEMGYDGWRLDQEWRKGQFVPQKTLYCWASGHAGVLLFGSRMTIGPYRRSQDFGFLDHYFCPRYVYGSIHALVGALAGCSFDKTLSENGREFAYQFKRGKEMIISAFTLDDSGQIEIQSDATSATLIDEMGNATGCPNPARVQMSLTNYPVYLVLEEATSPVLVK